jgi:hypothetical protein
MLKHGYIWHPEDVQYILPKHVGEVTKIKRSIVQQVGFDYLWIILRYSAVTNSTNYTVTANMHSNLF